MSQATSGRVVETLAQGIGEVAAALPGRLGVTVRFLDHGLETGLNEHERFPTASVIKVPIMVEVYRQVEAGDVRLDEPLPVLAEEISAGSGILQYLHVGLELTVADAIELMIDISDNTATNLLLRRVGVDNVNATMERMGLSHTRSSGHIGRHNPAPRTEGPSHTTPWETAELLARIADGRAISPAASAAMMQTLGHQMYDDMLPRELPLHSDLTVPGRHQLRVAHKTGSIEGVRNDAGVITVEREDGPRRVVVSAFTADVDDGNLWTPQNPCVLAVARVGRLAYDALIALG